MPFDHNDHYHRLLLRQVPPGCRTALDVGCGTGRFARRLAERGIEVDAIDASTEVIEVARALSANRPGHPAPRYRRADVTRTEPPAGHYDFVSCLAALHHMPFGTVATLRDALAPGGVLAVLGCHSEASAADRAWSLAAVPVNAAARLAVAARERLHPGPGPTDTLRAPVKRPETTLAEIRREAAALLPGATLRRLLFWRYLLVYRRPSDGPGTPSDG
ncbi:methyltransferase domain-containing protein [Streptomyces sp. TRM43335]|uniref:Methyltransferase domain-containing protein n=1 Tax=Streptomyces taklimakanensis TaxID=2569853 RepID=A0A6G2BDI8_9ACTN|nr:class I SAM-dependent methyltransferase [Streptomyces taklimakanensis]MTE20337.1 methyltransferase domain-containing protein [Streptomyces taklimakanensis]